jgi:hypothetical protein
MVKQNLNQVLVYNSNDTYQGAKMAGQKQTAPSCFSAVWN